MNPRTIEHVQSSFAAVAPIAPQAAGLFYARLFELDPTLRRLFGDDLAAQGGRLMEMIAAAVALLAKPERLDPVLAGLGARHAGYGVEDRHYDVVGMALLDTLAQGLGTAFTPAVRGAWTEVYGHIARVMRDGAAMAQRPAA